MRKIYNAIVVAVSVCVSGCAAVLVGGTAGGVMMAKDQRSLGAQTEDKEIYLRVTSLSAKLAATVNLNATVFNRTVLLTGQVPDAQTASRVEDEVRAIRGVQSVVNDLQIGAASTQASRAKDVFLTSRVITALMIEKDARVGNIKVSTEAGIVYLMGGTSRKEGEIAARTASAVSGVAKVVKVLNYTD